VYLNSANAGDWVRVSYPLSSPPPKVIRDYNYGRPISAAADLTELNNSTGDKYYYDSGTGTMHLKMVVQSGRNWATMFVVP
jgi:hypothetical protein